MASKERILTDHEEIRRWAEARGARPAVVEGTGGDDDPGILRLMFPGYSESDEESLEETSFDEFFRKFDESNLALIVQDKTAEGERSNFNKLVSRGTVEERKQERSRAHRTRSRPSATARGGRRAKTGTGRGRGQRRSAGRASRRVQSTTRTASSNRSSRSRASQSTRASSSSRLQRTASKRRSKQSQSGRSASTARKIRSERAKTGVRGKKRGASERSRREAA